MRYTIRLPVMDGTVFASDAVVAMPPAGAHVRRDGRIVGRVVEVQVVDDGKALEISAELDLS